MLLDLVRIDPVCRRLMSAPEVGPIVALTFRTCVDNLARFSRSKCVGAHYGLTPRLYQSGEVSRTGCISRRGDTKSIIAVRNPNPGLPTRNPH